MIVLFTDYGVTGPYLGQVENVLHLAAPGAPVINLMADAPAHRPKPSAYLLAALAGEFPEGSVFLAVVDPGVGGDRTPVVLEADGRWFVGPDNGLLEMVRRRAVPPPRCWEIRWQPDRLSNTFHGRDLFAPVAARLAAGETPDDGKDFHSLPVDGMLATNWPDELAEIIYIDGFGNAMTGTRAGAVSDDAKIEISGAVIEKAGKFSDVPEGRPFWYENANGLVELAVNRRRADEELKLSIGCHFTVRVM